MPANIEFWNKPEAETFPKGADLADVDWDPEISNIQNWKGAASRAQEWNQFVVLLYDKLIELIELQIAACEKAACELHKAALHKDTDKEAKAAENAMETTQKNWNNSLEQLQNRRIAAGGEEKEQLKPDKPAEATVDVEAFAKKLKFPVPKNDVASYERALLQAEAEKDSAHLKRMYVMVVVSGTEGEDLIRKAWPARLVKLYRHCTLICARSKQEELRKLNDNTFFGAPRSGSFTLEPDVPHYDDAAYQEKSGNDNSKTQILVDRNSFEGTHVCFLFRGSICASRCF
jgi:hypothetical protein